MQKDTPNKKVELLAPAGSLKALEFAFAYGADAVYAGQPRYSLRVRNNEFNLQNLEKGINYAHELNKKFYVVTNINPHNSKIKTFIEDITEVINLNPDALIMSDPGLIDLVQQHFPKQEIHLSVQANVVNFASVRFWQKQGISRIILSRELSLTEVKEIKAEVPKMELEVFVHGALCIAYSGRCLLSGYMNKRDANQGTCTNACRWKYNIQSEKETNNEPIPKTPITPEHSQASMQDNPSSKTIFLKEPNRQNELMPMYEDEHGTYIMNSKDLRAVELVPDLIKTGVQSLKIEGRTKSHYYVARTCQVYRQAIDDYYQGNPFNKNLIAELDGLANRGYTLGFLKRHQNSTFDASETQNYDYGSSQNDTQIFVGDIELTEYKQQPYLQVTVKNKFAIGDSMMLMTPKSNLTFILQEILIKNENTSRINKRLKVKQYQKIEVAAGSGYIVLINLSSILNQAKQNQTSKQITPEFTATKNLNHSLLLKNLNSEKQPKDIKPQQSEPINLTNKTATL